jgi:PPM family protein phosphatase
MLVAHGVTHPGSVRKINEDSLFWNLDLGLFLVADGMGGHNAGEVASRLAVDTMKGFMQRSRDGDDFTWPYGIDPQLSFDANRLMTAIKLANRRVFKAGESRDEYTGMGTTIVAALVEEDRLIISGVGDSRIYLFRGAKLTQLTRDDSWVATVLAREPGMDEATLASHPMRHVLTNVIGAREQTDVEVNEQMLNPGDVLLLCTDGLHGAIDDRTLESVLAGAPGDEKQAAERLVETALERNGSDNITALVVRHAA